MYIGILNHREKLGPRVIKNTTLIRKLLFVSKVDWEEISDETKSTNIVTFSIINSEIDPGIIFPWLLWKNVVIREFERGFWRQ